MDTKSFNCVADKVSPDQIIRSGVFFSGSISLKKDNNHLIIFKLVNKEEMTYILKDINFNKEVKLEIFAYDEYPKEVQHKSTWDKFN
jgi:hypothetical protein